MPEVAKHSEWKAMPANDDSDVDAGAWQVWRSYYNGNDIEPEYEDDWFGDFFSRANAEKIAAHLNALNDIPRWRA